MRKWSELKQAILDKLFLTEMEAKNQDYLSKFQYLTNECLNIIANGVKPYVTSIEVIGDKNEIVRMPVNFLSFSDFTNFDGIRFISDDEIQITESGTYRVYYNATYPEITKQIIEDDTILDIPFSILICIPTYVASQLLSQDDVQRSTILRNEFELMLSRLDTTVIYEEQHYHSKGEWY